MAECVKTTRKEQSTEMMVHCNFGWRGYFNGYYISGLFDLSEGEWDSNGKEKDETNYNNYLKIITYDAPR